MVSGPVRAVVDEALWHPDDIYKKDKARALKGHPFALVQGIPPYIPNVGDVVRPELTLETQVDDLAADLN